MDFIYEDEHIIAVEKAANDFIHPIPGEKESKDCLLFKVRDKLGSYVFPINRLDRPVSGIVLFAKSPEVVTKFQAIWHEDSTQKKYLCLHRGKLKAKGKFDSPLSKKGAFKKNENKEIKQDALTLYWPLEYFSQYFCTFTEVEIKTGRYHQIRRHFRKAIMPLHGDRKHGKGVVNQQFLEEFGLNRIFLHCHELNFHHPYTNQIVSLHCDLPADLQNILEKLRVSK